MRPQWDTTVRYMIMILVLILVVALLWYVREIFRPLITAAVVAYFLSPAVNFLVVQMRLRRRTAANFVYFASVALFITLLITAVPALFDELQSVSADLTLGLNDLQVMLQEPILIGNVPFRFGTLIPAIKQTFSGMIVPGPQDALRFLEVTSRNFLWLLVVLVTAYYLMTDWHTLRMKVIQLAPKDEQSVCRVRSLWVCWRACLSFFLKLVPLPRQVSQRSWLFSKDRISFRVQA